jgi:aspartate aminotransferase
MKGTDRLEKLSESQTLALTKRVRELQAAGEDIVGLTLGEPDFDTPDHIREAAIQAIKDGFTHYPPVAGIPDLRKAVAEKFKRDYGLDYGPANVVVSTGAKQSVINVVMSLLNPGDECILIAPYWVSYLEMLKMADAEAEIIHTEVETGYKVSPAQLEAAIGPKTKLIIFNSPNNPTGSTYSRKSCKGSRMCWPNTRKCIS